MDRCSLITGDEVARIDCLGRTRIATVESYAAVHYIVGRGWTRFLHMVEAENGDSVLCRFSTKCTCKVVSAPQTGARRQLGLVVRLGPPCPVCVFLAQIGAGRCSVACVRVAVEYKLMRGWERKPSVV